MNTPTPRRVTRRKPEALGYWLRVPLPRRSTRPGRPNPSGPVAISGCDYLGLSED
ncbi:MAG: hypothetical protein RLZZ356_874, partial [Verrucomicrobiota bacterium]